LDDQKKPLVVKRGSALLLGKCSKEIEKVAEEWTWGGEGRVAISGWWLETIERNRGISGRKEITGEAR